MRPVTRTLLSRRYSLSVTPSDPPPMIPGMVSLRLDLQGQLLQLNAVPTEEDAKPGTPAVADWSGLFKLAGAEFETSTAAEPATLPPVYADRRRAWKGTEVRGTPYLIHCRSFGVTYGATGTPPELSRPPPGTGRRSLPEKETSTA